MKNIINTLFKLQFKLQSRAIHTSFRNKGYEGPGKTTVTIVNEMNDILLIDHYTPAGFGLNNSCFIVGPTILFPKCVFSWHVKSSEDVNESSLVLFKFLVPKPDIVLIGLEKKHDFELYKKLKNLLEKLDLKGDILPIRNACSTFNFISEEGRHVAGAFIPPLVDNFIFNKHTEMQARNRTRFDHLKPQKLSLKKPPKVEGAITDGKKEDTSKIIDEGKRKE